MNKYNVRDKLRWVGMQQYFLIQQDYLNMKKVISIKLGRLRGLIYITFNLIDIHL